MPKLPSHSSVLASLRIKLERQEKAVAKRTPPKGDAPPMPEGEERQPMLDWDAIQGYGKLPNGVDECPADPWGRDARWVFCEGSGERLADDRNELDYRLEVEEWKAAGGVE